MFFLKRKRKKDASHTAGAATDVPTICAAVSSDVGLLRSNNEDNFLMGRHTNPSCCNHCEAFVESSNDVWFFAGVFDGMGGGDIGEVAAKAAAETFLDAEDRLDKDASQTQVDTALRKAFLDANNKIVDLQQHHQVFGTTGTVLATNGTIYKVYHLGDSRAYLVRETELYQLTRDQTLAQMKIDVGLYQPDDPKAEEEKHHLTEYIGKDQTKQYLHPLEGDWSDLRPGDGILLCSDGLYDMCSDRMIGETLIAHSEIQQKTNALVDAALSQGGIDNITCIYLIRR